MSAETTTASGHWAANISQPPAPEASAGDWMDWANAMPSLKALGLTCTSMTEGATEFVLDPRSFPLNLNGAVNGGVVACAADQAMGITAVRGARSHPYAFTISMTTQFHRSAMPPLVLRAKFVAGGSRVAFVNIEMEGADGSQCASAQGALRLSAGGASS